jgi:hypothetical protein
LAWHPLQRKALLVYGDGRRLLLANAQALLVLDEALLNVDMRICSHREPVRRGRVRCSAGPTTYDA